jgi:hypothetical protein
MVSHVIVRSSKLVTKIVSWYKCRIKNEPYGSCADYAACSGVGRVVVKDQIWKSCELNMRK